METAKQMNLIYTFFFSKLQSGKPGLVDVEAEVSSIDNQRVVVTTRDESGTYKFLLLFVHVIQAVVI